MEWMLLPLKRYADFSGRSRRKEYWMFALFLFLIYMALMVLMIAVGAGAFLAMAGGSGAGAGALGAGSIAVFGLFGVFVLAIIIPSIAVAVRRLHDTDRSGWWVLAPLAPNVLAAVFGDGVIATVMSLAALGLSIALLVFYCLPGTVGPNRFGSDPKGSDLGDVFA